MIFLKTRSNTLFWNSLFLIFENCTKMNQRLGCNNNFHWPLALVQVNAVVPIYFYLMKVMKLSQHKNSFIYYFCITLLWYCFMWCDLFHPIRQLKAASAAIICRSQSRVKAFGADFNWTFLYLLHSCWECETAFRRTQDTTHFSLKPRLMKFFDDYQLQNADTPADSVFGDTNTEQLVSEIQLAFTVKG